VLTTAAYITVLNLGCYVMFISCFVFYYYRATMRSIYACTVTKRKHLAKNIQLENMAIANALQLEAARRRTVPLCFNSVDRAKFEVAQPIRCRLRAFLLLIRYVTL